MAQAPADEMTDAVHPAVTGHVVPAVVVAADDATR